MNYKDIPHIKENLDNIEKENITLRTQMNRGWNIAVISGILLIILFLLVNGLEE